MLIRYSLFLIIFLSLNLAALENGKPVSTNMPLVSIHFNNGYICSGAYINAETILTAAHCLDGFEIISIRDSQDKVINVKALKQLKHPGFKWSFIWSAHDIGVIKTTSVNREYYYPVIDDKNESNIYIAACGKQEVDGERSGCSYGKNRGLKIWRYYISTGEANVLPNDSGGIILDSTAKRILGVVWGWNNSIGVHFNFSSSFSNDKNRDFVQQNL